MLSLFRQKSPPWTRQIIYDLALTKNCVVLQNPVSDCRTSRTRTNSDSNASHCLMCYACTNTRVLLMTTLWSSYYSYPHFFAWGNRGKHWLSWGAQLVMKLWWVLQGRALDCFIVLPLRMQPKQNNVYNRRYCCHFWNATVWENEFGKLHKFVSLLVKQKEYAKLKRQCIWLFRQLHYRS